MASANISNLDILRVPELKALVKSKGLRGYSKLRKAELIDLLRESDRPRKSKGKQPQVIFVDTVPLVEFGGSLLDAPIPLNEISQDSTILKPTKAKVEKIERVVEWGKKKIENWGEWLKEIDSVENTQPVVDDALKTFKAHITELYKRSKQLEHQQRLTPLTITKTHSKYNKKFKAFIDIFKISGDCF